MITFLVMKTELLAPAGSAAGMKAVIAAGADAVYIGGSRFGARAYADNPGEDDLAQLIDYAHLRGVRVYLTVNTLLKERELADLNDWIRPYVMRGLDAVLVQDFGVLSHLRAAFPSLPLHASTQMTISGPESAALIARYGVTRVVPARELSIDELVRIKQETGVEVETFVHGALCYCYSGQCLLSSMIGGRSGNRGRCAQPCRLLNLLNDRDGFDGKTSILLRKDARHFMSPKDLNAVRLLPELIRAGIDSLKIEGRMKQPEYAAGVVSIYRTCLDRAYRCLETGTEYYVTDEEQQMLYDLYNRSGFNEGYFHERSGPDMMALVKHELTPKETEARHKLYDRMHAAFMDREKEVPAKAVFEIRKGRPITAELCSGNTRIRVSGQTADAARKQPLSEERILEQVVKTGGSDFCFTDVRVLTDGSSFVPVSALNELRRRAVSSLRDEMLRTYQRNETDCADVCCDEEHGPFGQPNADEEKQPALTASARTPALRVIVSDRAQFEAALREPAVSLIYLEAAFLYREKDPVQTAGERIRLCRRHGKEAGIAMPRIDRDGSDATLIKEHARDLIELGLHEFLVRSFETLAWFVRRGLAGSVRADASIYTFNHEAADFLRTLGVMRDTAPVELNRKELYARDNRASEIIAYGSLPLMISAQCLKKNTDRCTKAHETLTLTDRTGTKFAVKCECVFCYNILYNSLPLSLLTEMEALKRMQFEAVRIDFTTEDGQTAKNVLNAAAGALCGKPVQSDTQTTKGHFLRGVE